MIQVQLFISGSVHGVGFRQFVKSYAQKLGLTGWVRNISDGRVEAVIQGEKQDIEKMIELCKKGPTFAEVESVEVLWEEIDDFSNEFNIR